MKKIIPIVLLAVLPLFPQGTFPLSVGNVWQYGIKTVRNGQPVVVYGWTEWVERDTVMPNGLTYAFIRNDGHEPVKFLRQEGSLVTSYVDAFSERTEYDFSAAAGDTMWFTPYPNDTLYCTIVQNDTKALFSQSRHRQVYEYKYLHATEPVYHDVYDGIGVALVVPGPSGSYSLTGAIIGGAQYGVITAVRGNDGAALPLRATLSQNYPNPFNGSAAIPFTLPADDRISLTVCDVMGRTVDVLGEGMFRSGAHTVRWDASRAASGVYFYTLTTSTSRQTRRMVLIR